MGLKNSFGLVHGTDFREERAGVEVPGEAVELVFGSDGVDLHAPVIFVAHPASDADFTGTVHHEPAKTDALNATVHKPAASAGGGLLLVHLVSLASKKTAARDPGRP